MSEQVPPAVWHAITSIPRQRRRIGDCTCGGCQGCDARDANDDTWRAIRAANRNRTEGTPA